jgi:hypothetical protein
MSIGVAGNDATDEDAGVGRVGYEVGGAMGSVSDSRLVRDAVDSDRDGRVSISSPCWLPEALAPALALGITELGGVETSGRRGGGIDSETEEEASDVDSADEEESTLRRAGASSSDEDELSCSLAARPLLRARGGRPAVGLDLDDSMVSNVKRNRS